MTPVAGLVQIVASDAFGPAAEYVELVQVQIIPGMNIHGCLSLMALVAVVVFVARFT